MAAAAALAGVFDEAEKRRQRASARGRCVLPTIDSSFSNLLADRLCAAHPGGSSSAAHASRTRSGAAHSGGRSSSSAIVRTRVESVRLEVVDLEEREGEVYAPVVDHVGRSYFSMRAVTAVPS